MSVLATLSGISRTRAGSSPMRLDGDVARRGTAPENDQGYGAWRSRRRAASTIYGWCRPTRKRHRRPPRRGHARRVALPRRHAAARSAQPRVCYCGPARPYHVVAGDAEVTAVWPRFSGWCTAAGNAARLFRGARIRMRAAARAAPRRSPEPAQSFGHRDRGAVVFDDLEAAQRRVTAMMRERVDDVFAPNPPRTGEPTPGLRRDPDA